MQSLRICNSLIILCLFFLAACGGGSSGSDSGGVGTPGGSNGNPQPAAQTPLTFDQPTVEVGINGSVPENPLSGGSGSGDVTYISSDESVATVDIDTGTVTPASIGTATITATKGADSHYLSASASYTLVVTKAEQEPLVFAEETIELFIDEPVPENLVEGGSGSGALLYSSSNLAVAEIDAETGLITVKGEGSTIVTVIKQADDDYKEASAFYTLIVNKYEQQALAFTYDEISGAVTTKAPENPLTGGEGEGAVSYHSSDDSIALVNAQSGVVTLVATGEATITALKSGDDLFKESQASYSITAYEVVSGLDVQVGLSDTKIAWKEQHGTIETIRTSQYNCHLDNYPSCSSVRVRSISHASATPYTDSYPKIGNLAYLHLQNSDYRSSQIRIEPAPLAVTGRMWPAMAAFKERLWIIGGTYSELDADGEVVDIHHNDIWSSENGIDWVQETANANFSPRNGHSLIEFDGDLYMYGGVELLDNGSYMAASGIWKSPDGINWDQVQSNAPFYGGISNITIFNDKLWIITIADGSHASNEIWFSEDGENWSLALANAPFPVRYSATLYADDEQLYLMGGYTGSGDDESSYEDVWMSSDGIQWDRAAESGGYGSFNDGSVIRFDGRFYAIGGWRSESYEQPAFVSDNGINWNRLPESDYIKDLIVDVVVFNGAMWTAILAGPTHYMWTTTDGFNWRVPVDVGEVQWFER